jgi:hypothetical protein
LLIFVLLICMHPSQGRADDCLQLTGQWGYGPAHRLSATESHVYWASGAVVRVTETTDPLLAVVGEATLPGLPEDLFIHGDMLLVAAGDAGLRIVDVADPQQPVEVGFFDTQGTARAVGVYGSNACVLVTEPGAAQLPTGSKLLIIDLTNPGLPLLVGAYTSEVAASVLAVAGNVGSGHAFIGDNQGLQIIDLSDPADPSLTASIRPSFYQTGYSQRSSAIAFSGNRLYLAALKSASWQAYGSLLVIDITDCSSPTVLQEVDQLLERRMIIRDGHLLSMFGELKVLDLSDLSSTTRYDGDVADLVLSGNRLFVADQVTGLSSYSMSDPETIIGPGIGSVSGLPTDTVISGQYAYVGTCEAGVRVIDLAAPTVPVETGSLATPAPVSSLAVTNDLLLVGDTTGLQVASIAGGTAQEQGFVAIGSVTDIAASGATAYTAAGLLYIVGLQNPGQPTVNGPLGIPARQVALLDGYLVVAHEHGMAIYYLVNPGLPVQVATWTQEWDPRELVVDGSTVYLATHDTGLWLFNLADPHSPGLILHYQGDHCREALDLIVVDGLVMALTEQGLVTLDVTDPAQPIEKLYGYPGTTIASDGSNAYLTRANDYICSELTRFSLEALDTSDQSSIRLIGRTAVPAATTQLAVAGGLALVTSDQGLRIIDVSQPAQPTESVFGLASAEWVAVAGERAYVVTADEGLQILDLSQPAAIAVIGVEPSSSGQLVAVSGSSAYVVRNQQLITVDVTDPTAPAVTGQLDDPLLSSTADITVSNGFAYLAHGWNGLSTVDVSTPSAPVMAARVDGIDGDVTGVAVNGSYAYLSAGREGTVIYDVSDPAHPVSAGQVLLPEHANAVAITIAGDQALVAAEDAGVYLFDVSDPGQLLVAGTTPGQAVDVAAAGTYTYVADNMAGVSVLDLTTCALQPPAALFSDGFESGDTSRWSETVW